MHSVEIGPCILQPPKGGPPSQWSIFRDHFEGYSAGFISGVRVGAGFQQRGDDVGGPATRYSNLQWPVPCTQVGSSIGQNRDARVRRAEPARSSSNRCGRPELPATAVSSGRSVSGGFLGTLGSFLGSGVRDRNSDLPAPSRSLPNRDLYKGHVDLVAPALPDFVRGHRLEEERDRFL